MVFFFSYIQKMIMLTVYAVGSIGFGEKEKGVQIIKKFTKVEMPRYRYSIWFGNGNKNNKDTMHLVTIIVKSTMFNNKKTY